MSRVLGLPVTNAKGGQTTPSGKSPNVEQMRATLGGRAATPATAGRLVQLRTSEWVALPGVLLSETEQAAWVLTSPEIVRRTAPDNLEPISASSAELQELAQAVRRFAQLTEAEAVRVRDARLGTFDGVLVEKCRFGALVLRTDQTLVAVGFAKLSPAASADEELPAEGDEL